MTTMIYGASAELLTTHGDVEGRVSLMALERDTDDQPCTACLLMCSDGTLIEAVLDTRNDPAWGFTVLHAGRLFQLLTTMASPSDPEERQSIDVVRFADGLRWVYAATRWAEVR